MASLHKMVHAMEESVRSAMINSVNNPVKLIKWINQCSTNIKLLTGSLKEGRLSVGGKRLLESAIGKIKGYKVTMKALNHQGCGGPTRNRRSSRVKWQEVSSFNSHLRMGVGVNLQHKDPRKFLKDSQFLVTMRLKKALKTNHCLKVNLDFGCKYRKFGSNEVDFKHFITLNSIINRQMELKNWWQDENIENQILAQMDEFQDQASGWTLEAVINLAVNIYKYEPLRHSSYVELPDDIKNKKACINVQNTDVACFGWTITSALHPVGSNDHPQRTSSYPLYAKVLNFDGIKFPMTLNQIGKFEKLNNLSINVYVLEPTVETMKISRVYPTQITKNKQQRHVNLLLIQSTYNENEDGPIIYHYCWIKNLSQLILRQTSGHKGKIYICDRCLDYFYLEEKLHSYEIDCGELNKCRVTMPQKDEVVKFQNFNNQDTESILKPIDKNSTKYQEDYYHIRTIQ